MVAALRVEPPVLQLRQRPIERWPADHRSSYRKQSEPLRGRPADADSSIPRATPGHRLGPPLPAVRPARIAADRPGREHRAALERAAVFPPDPSVERQRARSGAALAAGLSGSHRRPTDRGHQPQPLGDHLRQRSRPAAWRDQWRADGNRRVEQARRAARALPAGRLRRYRGADLYGWRPGCGVRRACPADQHLPAADTGAQHQCVRGQVLLLGIGLNGNKGFEG